MCNSRNVLITASVKSAINNANSPLGHNIAVSETNTLITFLMPYVLRKLIILHDCVKRNV